MSDAAPNPTLQFRTHSAAETERVAERLAGVLRAGDVIALEGELGAGKTCFVRGLARGLDIDPSLISSPTFVIAHEYSGSRTPLTHIDAYRIASADDLETIGFGEMLEAGDAIIAIEWPSRIAPSLPRDRIDVTIETAGETERLIRIAAPGSLSVQLKGIGMTATDASTVKCRTCGKPIDVGIRAYPFCSDRCRMADLGGWFAGAHKLSRKLTSEDELSE